MCRTAENNTPVQCASILTGTHWLLLININRFSEFTLSVHCQGQVCSLESVSLLCVVTRRMIKSSLPFLLLWDESSLKLNVMFWCHKCIWRSRGMAPRILNPVIRWRHVVSVVPRPFYCQVSSPWQLVSPRADLHFFFWRRWMFLNLTGNRTSLLRSFTP